MKLDPFDKFLKLIGRDYWQMPKEGLYKLAKEYRLEGISNPAYSSPSDGPQLYDFFLKNLSLEDCKYLQIDRKKVIDQLVARDKFASSFVAIIISVFALVISILVAIFK